MRFKIQKLFVFRNLSSVIDGSLQRHACSNIHHSALQEPLSKM